MSDRSQSLASSTAEAIDQVLSAEARIRERVEACRAQLAQGLAAEQERARAIQRRTDERLARIQVACNATIQREIAMRHEHAARQAVAPEPDAMARHLLEQAVALLAARMAGRGDG